MPAGEFWKVIPVERDDGPSTQDAREQEEGNLSEISAAVREMHVDHVLLRAPYDDERRAEHEKRVAAHRWPFPRRDDPDLVGPDRIVADGAQHGLRAADGSGRGTNVNRAET